MVAFLDLDQELLAPRYRAAEQALAPAGPGRPPAAVAREREGSPGAPDPPARSTRSSRPRCTPTPPGSPTPSAERRRVLGYPPATAMAAVAAPWPRRPRRGARIADGVEVLGPGDGRWLLRAADHETLCDALAAVPRPPAASASRSTPSDV